MDGVTAEKPQVAGPVDIADGVSLKRRRRPVHHTGLPSVHLYPSERVKPVTTRLPRLVARGCPADAPGHVVRDTFLRRIHPDGNPSHQDLYLSVGPGDPGVAWDGEGWFRRANALRRRGSLITLRVPLYVIVIGRRKNLAEMRDCCSTKLDPIGQHTVVSPETGAALHGIGLRVPCQAPVK